MTYVMRVRYERGNSKERRKGWEGLDLEKLLCAAGIRIHYVDMVKIAQSCLILCDLMDYTVHGILQARILEWVAVPFSRGSSWPRNPPAIWATRVRSLGSLGHSKSQTRLSDYMTTMLKTGKGGGGFEETCWKSWCLRDMQVETPLAWSRSGNWNYRNRFKATQKE